MWSGKRVFRTLFSEVPWPSLSDQSEPWTYFRAVRRNKYSNITLD